MVYIPIAVEKRIKKNLSKYKRILKKAKDMDIKETDTVIIIVDMITDILGYDKFTEITAEQVIKGTYCDLAIKSGEDIKFLIEVKAIGVNLKDSHLKQALDYAANEGVNWAILTNGEIWDVYRVIFKRPIGKKHMFKLNMIEANTRDQKVLEQIYTLCKEGLSKGAMNEYQQRKQAMNKYMISALIQDDDVVHEIRKQLRKISKGVKIEKEAIRDVIINDVLKREVLDPEQLKEAQKRIKNARTTPKKG